MQWRRESLFVITVCVGSSCYVKGAHKVAECFQSLINSHNLAGKVELVGAFCHNRCKDGVAVSVNGISLPRVTPEMAQSIFDRYILSEAMK